MKTISRRASSAPVDPWAAFCCAVMVLTPAIVGPAGAEDVARGPAYSSSYHFSPATRQVLLVPPTLDPEKFAKDQKLAGYDVVRVPPDFSTYGGWALISFQGSEEDAQNLCKNNPALKLCELDRCREFLPASESGFVPGLGAWRPEKEFLVALAEGAESSGGSPATGAAGNAPATVNVSGPNAVAHTREQPPTPERFVSGARIDYGPDAAKGPDLTTLPGWAASKLMINRNQEAEVGSGWDQIVVRPPIGPPVVARANDDVPGTITRPPGGGTPTPPTAPRPPKPPFPPETPEKPPDLSPPGNPPTSTPPPEEGEEPLACKLFGGQGSQGFGLKVGLPDVKEFIEPPPKEPGQEALNDPAIAGEQVWLHDLSFFHFTHDLHVKSVGVDFNATRFYRSNIKTKEGGLFGYNWDFGYYKRLIPLGGTLNNKYAIRVETLMMPGPVNYLRGNGRVEAMKPNGVQFQMVKNFGGRFDAWVTYYKAPENLFAELERYAVLPGHVSPFASHPNYEGDIFYVMRYGNGYREVYSCRGILLYVLDRNDNRMTFMYNAAMFHPFTFNPELDYMLDTAQRRYTVKWKEMEGSGYVRTNYKGQVIAGEFPKNRLAGIKEEFDGREVEYRYQGDNQRPVLEKTVERKDGSFATAYGYSELDGRRYMETLTLPRENAGGGMPYLTNTWRRDGDVKRIESQTVGHGGTGTAQGGFEGGVTRFVRESKERVIVTSPRGTEETYTLERAAEAYVVAKMEVTLEGGRVATTTVSHNASDQITTLTKPEGNSIQYEYASGGGPVTEGPIRDCLNCGGGTGGLGLSSGSSFSGPSAAGGGLSAPTIGMAKGGGGGEEGGVTYLNNLAKGNLVKKSLLAGNRTNPLSYSSIITAYTYEPLYNQFQRIEGPGNAVTELEYDYFTRGAEGNPVVRRHPARTTATGESAGPVETRYEYTYTGLLLQETDPLNHKTVYAYNPPGYLLSVSDDADPQDNVSFGRDPRGNMIKLTDARGTITTLKVDQRDLLLEKVEDDAEKGFKNRTAYTYDENGNLTKEEITVHDNFPADDAFAAVPRQSFQFTKTYQYNLLNLQTGETQSAGGLSRTRTLAYDAEGRLTHVSEPEGFSIAYRHDRLGNVVEKTLGGRLTETYAYDLNGNLVKRTRGGRSVTTYQPDAFDRPYRTVLPEGTQILEPLTPDGSVGMIDVQGINHDGKSVKLRLVEFQYDEIGDRIGTTESILDPDGNQVGMRSERLVRDAEGKLSVLIDARKNQTLFTYDGHQKISDTDPLLNEVRYRYEPGGLPGSITEIEREIAFRERGGEPKPEEKSGRYVKTMTYDALGRVTSFTAPGGSSVRMAYDSEGRLRARADGSGRLDWFAFDGLGRGVHDEQFADLPVDKLTVDRTFDLHDRLLTASVTRGERTVSRTARTYNAAGWLERAEDDGDARTYAEFDDRGNPLQEKRADGVTLTYRYDREDRTKDVAVSYPGHRQGGSTHDTFVYDGLGRIVEAGRYRGMIKNKLAYDSLGNPRWEEQIVGISPLRLDYGYDAVGARTEMRGPAIGAEPSWTVKSERDHVGRVHLLRHQVSGDPQPAQGVIYEFTGSTRVARRTIGGILHTVYDYDEGRRPAGARVYSSLERMATFESQLDPAARLLSQGSRIAMPFESTHSETSEFDYTAWGARARVNAAFQWSDKPTDTQASGANRRLYRYKNDQVTAIFSGQETRSNQPGRLYGRNENDATTGERIDLTYDGNLLARAEFLHMGGLAAGLSDAKLKSALSDGTVEKKYTTWYRYDALGRLSEDNRYRYEYDHRSLVSQVGDKYADTHYETGTVTYYYDYADRLVSIAYDGPVGRDRRFLYDGRLPFLEIRLDKRGAPKDVETAYVTHPDGIDVGPIRVSTHYDVRGAKEPPPSFVYPFFDLDGSLAFVHDVESRDYLKVGLILDSAVRSDARRRHVILTRPDKDFRPEDLVALRPEHPRREIPLMSLHARWELFMEAALDLRSGRVMHDPLRNLQLREQTAQQARSDYLNEQISISQRNFLKGMALLGALPFAVPASIGAAIHYPVSTALTTALGIALDMVVVETVFQEEYGLDDFGESLVSGTVLMGGFTAAKELWKLRQATRLFGNLDELRHVRSTGKMRGNLEPGFQPDVPPTTPPVAKGPAGAATRRASAAEAAAASPSPTAGRSALPPLQDVSPAGHPSLGSGRLVLFGVGLRRIKPDMFLEEFNRIMARNIAPVQGVFDIMIHGTPEGGAIFAMDKWFPVSPQTIAALARAKGFQRGMTVRLLACDSGALPKGFAKQVAEALDTRVFAPNAGVFPGYNGKWVLGKLNNKAPGEWFEFTPNRIRQWPKTVRALYGDVPWLMR